MGLWLSIQCSKTIVEKQTKALLVSKEIDQGHGIAQKHPGGAALQIQPATLRTDRCN